VTVAVEAVGLIRIHPSSAGPVAALRGLDIRLSAGEVGAVVGPSGSGKSTFLRILAGQDRPSAGRLSVFGQDLSAASPAQLERHRRQVVGVVDQHYRRALSSDLRVAELVELPLALRGVPRAERRRRAAELLERVGLADRAGAYGRELSGGQQQRVAAAAALAPGPRLLLADEPTGELDAASAEQLLAALRDLVRAEGSTCVIATHDTRVVQVADEVVYLQDGRAVAARRGTRPPARTVDSHGWLAPELPTPPDRVAPRSPVAADEAVVALEAAGRAYGRDGLGLRPTDARVTRGAVHVVSGPSGSGKTTLLRLVVGLDRPTSGRVVTLGSDVGLLDRTRRARLRATSIGLVDQVRDLVPFLTVVENVELGLAVRSRPVERARAVAALDRLDIGRLAGRLPDSLSAGERLRVSLARAIVADPELLVLDEPTAALDRTAARRVARLMHDLAGVATVLVATHDPELIDVAAEQTVLA
jgi:ABC-type lipoprotein export system ATPase subunit